MTKQTTRMAAAFALAVFMFAGNSFAAVNVAVNATGSSGMFNLAALGGFSANVCGTNIWTQKSSSSAPIEGVDQRPGGGPVQTGNIWVIWNTAKTTACVYLTVDSTVGNQMFFAVPKYTLSIASSLSGAAGANLIPTLTDVALDPTIFTAINNQPFNCAMTDVRPEDALFEENRVLGALDPIGYTGLGYGPPPVGTPILSTFSTKSATPVLFALSGTDPISGGTVPAWTTRAVGAEPVVVFVNTQDTTSGGFGSTNFENISRFDLANVLNGTLTRTRDIANLPNLPSVGIQTILREPLSGTYTTMEFNVPRNQEINSSQELNVNPGATGGNPLDIVYASGGTRKRAIGTGEMVSEVGKIQDAFGYAFWSTGNFAGVLTTTKYLSVDGVDPINYHWLLSRGVFPNCIYPCKGLIPFPNILNGSYPIWTILQVAANLPFPQGVKALIANAQTQALNGFPDFVPVSSLQVFRSHFDRPEELTPASNGNPGEPAESGGSVGGAVFSVQSDLDNFTDTGLQLLGGKQ